MDVSRPILDVVPGARGRVLSALVTRSAIRMTGREVARLAGVPATTAQRVLDDLVDAGLVTAERLGAAYGYQLHRQHLLAGAVIDLAEARSRFLDAVQDVVKEWPIQPVGGWLFGSTARADGDRRSDIDLLLVAPEDADKDEWDDQVSELSGMIYRLTGNYAQIIVYTPASFRELVQAGSSFVANVRAEGFDLFDLSWERLR